MFSLEEWRRVRGVSQQAIADACDIHVNTYRGWEENPSRIPYGAAVRIASFLDVPFNDINFLTEKSTKTVETTTGATS